MMRRYIEYLSQPKLFFYVLIAMMVVLVVGTVSQKYVGLYLSQKWFFDAYFYWLWGVIPLPMMRALMVLAAINLLAKLLTASPWSAKQGGIIITHMGVFILLLGGGITGELSEEGFMLLTEGQQSNIISDYHIREWVIAKEDVETETRQVIYGPVGISEFSTGDEILGEAGEFAVKFQSIFSNARLADKGEGDWTLSEAELFPEDEMNRAGAEILFAETGKAAVKVPVLEGREVKILGHEGTSRYIFMVRKQERILPFTLYLDDFKQTLHPGTSKAKAYESKVRVRQGDDNGWRADISMNQPLRYRGYTFFQSSFVEGETEQSILAVVKNEGRIFPYVSGTIICLGILWHLVVTGRRRV